MSINDRLAQKGAASSSIPIPREFLCERIALIDDPTELHVTLAVFRLAADFGSSPPAVREDLVLDDPVLARTFHEDRRSSRLSQRIRRGLQYATARESVIQVVLSTESQEERWYIPASDENRAGLARIMNEQEAWPVAGTSSVIVAAAPSVYSLYEKNIGMLTPLLTDQIENALDLYPLAWIEDAIQEAVNYNKRNWRYILRVLESWNVNGRGERGNHHETNRGDGPEPFDPALYKQRRRKST